MHCIGIFFTCNFLVGHSSYGQATCATHLNYLGRALMALTSLTLLSHSTILEDFPFLALLTSLTNNEELCFIWRVQGNLTKHHKQAFRLLMSNSNFYMSIHCIKVRTSSGASLINKDAVTGDSYIRMLL